MSDFKEIRETLEFPANIYYSHSCCVPINKVFDVNYRNYKNTFIIKCSKSTAINLTNMNKGEHHKIKNKTIYFSK